MKQRLNAAILIAAAWCAVTCARTASGRDLQTIYTVGRYPVKTTHELGIAIRNMIAQSADTKNAWQLTEKSARQNLFAQPMLAPLNIPMVKAQANNRVNTDVARRTLDLSLAYAVAGDKRYRDKAVANLRMFIATFPPVATLEGIEAEHQHHALYSRDWLPLLAYSYDILHDTLSPAEDREISGWMKGMLAFIVTPKSWNKWRHTTQGAWHAAVIGIVGAATMDAKLQQLAEERIKYHFTSVVGGDGMWPGGSLEFHYAAARAYQAYAEATMRRGASAWYWHNTRDEQYMRRIMNGPLMLVDPFGMIPGDNRMATEPPPADLYLIAAQRLKDPLYASFARMTIASVPTWQVLLYADVRVALPQPEARPIYSTVSPTMGWALLRTGGAKVQKELYARLDYGPQGGGDGHADKLALYLCGYGKRVTSDDDTYPVGNPMRGRWGKQTVAHNTVVVNYQSQLGASSPVDAGGLPGTLLLFDRTPGISVVEAGAQNSYPFAPMAAYRRFVAMTDKYVVDVFSISAAKPITADWVFHGLGRGVTIEHAAEGERSLNNEAVEESILGSSVGYQWIDDVASYTANEQWTATWVSGLRTMMMGQPGTLIMTGKSGGEVKIVDEKIVERTYSQQTVMARRVNVLDTRFVALHEIMTTNQPQVESFARLDTGTETLVLEVLMREYKDIIIIQPKKAVQDFVVDEQHRITTEERRYAYARFNRKSGSVMEAVNLAVSPVQP